MVIITTGCTEPGWCLDHVVRVLGSFGDERGEGGLLVDNPAAGEGELQGSHSELDLIW